MESSQEGRRQSLGGSHNTIPLDDGSDDDRLVPLTQKRRRHFVSPPLPSPPQPHEPAGGNDTDDDFYPCDDEKDDTDDENLIPNSNKKNIMKKMQKNGNGSPAATTECVVSDAHFAALTAIESFVQTYDFHTIPSLIPSKGQTEPSIVHLQEDDRCNAADFLQSLCRNFLAEEVCTTNGMMLRREYLCDERPEEENEFDIPYPFVENDSDVVEVQGSMSEVDVEDSLDLAEGSCGIHERGRLRRRLRPRASHKILL